MYVYIVLCSDDTYYVGVTNNLDLRLKQHERGISESSYTFSRRPLKLVYYEIFSNPLDAIAFEKRIKKWSKAKKKALIDSRFNDLPLLSKKKFN